MTSYNDKIFAAETEYYYEEEDFMEDEEYDECTTCTKFISHEDDLLAQEAEDNAWLEEYANEEYYDDDE